MKMPRDLLRVDSAETGKRFSEAYLVPAADKISFNEHGAPFAKAKTGGVRRTQRTAKNHDAQWKEINFSANKNRPNGELIIVYNVLLRATIDPKKFGFDEKQGEELADWYLGESNRYVVREQEYIMTTENYIPSKEARIALIQDDVIIGSMENPSSTPDTISSAIDSHNKILAEVLERDIWLPGDVHTIVRILSHLDLLEGAK